MIRKYRWPLGRRPDDHPGLFELGPVGSLERKDGRGLTEVVSATSTARR